MRLLHYDEQKRFVLRDFSGKTTPPYAILSHRWSDSEVLFEDIASGEYKERQEGYRKLLFCAQRAALDGLSYFWIDTCCIDKWNLRERSKAINSMFQWYRNSTRCYVFLADVSISAAIEISQRNDWEASFRASAWFTRGWTLQELIAPVSVEFFSCEENRIGDKTSLNELIHDITKIPSAVLRNCPLGDFTTSERRRWVENRTTTEEEDIVYCLLGILSVSMPTAYGEGRESAQSRLLAEMEAGANVPSIIPFSRNHHFVGQESQLAELEEKLFSNDQTTTTLAIVGAGGTGKSQLALEVAHRTRQNNKSCSVFWIDARDKDRLFQSYSNIAQKLSIPGWDDEHADMKRIIQRCVAKMSERQCVLIFDNAEHTTVQYIGVSTAEATGLTDCLPQSKLCSAIFTTTEYNVAKALASQGIIALQHLTQKSAFKMLQTRLARPLSEADQWEAKQLLKELWYLPLAVMQAVAYMNASCVTLQEYRSRLAEHKKTAIQHSSDLFEGGIGEFLAKASVTATMLLSLIQVQHNNPLAADYLCFIACVDQRDIPLDLLEAVSSQEREHAIRVLEEYALVTRRPADSALDVHRLVHQALQKQLQALGQFEKWTQNAVATLSRVFPRNAHSSRSKWRRLLPHAQYAVSHSPTDDDDKNRLDLMFKCSWTLYNEGRHEEAEVLQAQVMQARRRLLGDDHPDTLISMSSLVLTYNGQGRWDEAEELQKQELEGTRLVFGADDPQTLASMSNLATIYHRQGRLKEAEELETYVMEEFKIIYRGWDYLPTLTSMSNLGIIYVDQGRLEEAEDLQIEAVKGLKNLFGEDHPETLTAMGNLASTYCDQSRLKQAEELQIQVLHTESRVLGEEHPGTLLGMHNLAVTLQKQHRYTEALALMEKCAQMRQQVLGKHHPSTQFSLEHVNLWRAPG